MQIAKKLFVVSAIFAPVVCRAAPSRYIQQSPSPRRMEEARSQLQGVGSVPVVRALH